jgi:asparagine synthase (glutamine-hydrolysing)
VVLTGQCTDEPWGGYRKYQQELLRSQAPEWMWRKLSHIPISPFLPDPITRGLRSMPHPNIVDRLVENYTLFPSVQRKRYTGRADSGSAHERVRHWLAWQSNGTLHPTEQQMRIDTRMNLSDDLLLYGDKLSMAFGLETRVPMLDMQLVDFVESLPLPYKRTLRQGKIIHKAMAEQYLPKEIVHRPKKGFQVPFGKWCKDQWKHRVASILLSKGAAHHDLINKQEIESIWKQHQRGANHERPLFALLSFALWYDQLKAS